MKFHIALYVAAALMISACKQPVSPDIIINSKASLPPAFGINKLGVITSTINKRHHTMSTLYGNLISVNRSRSSAPIGAGEKLVLVTWTQKPDESWFGANIPAQVQTVEQITTGGKPDSVKYLRYAGQQLTAVRDTTGEASRIHTILGMQASIMP